MHKTEIKFGTDGFRGIIAKEFTFETVERIINAISLYLRSLNTENKNIIVGYDPRFMASDFAKFCAELLSLNGFNVILSSKVVPTPIVAFNAKYYPASVGAIMLTASHNPKEYQGIKFIPNYGGPATKEITDEIIKFVDCDIKKTNDGKIEIKDLENEYFAQIEKLIDFDIIKKKQPKIIYDGLFSSSIGYFDKLLDRNNIKYESYNMYHSSDFGGNLPEPKEKYMKNKKQGYIVVANDGDADRYGVLDENGNYVSPNIILALLLKYLVEKGKKGSMVKTVGVSSLVDIVARKLNVNVITTKVGFKWLSETMRTNETILAGEDSGGLSTGDHIAEKDGLYANLLIIEMMARKNKTLVELVQDIKNFAGKEFFNDRVDLKLKDTDDIEEYQNKILNLDSIQGFKVKEIQNLGGKKMFFEDDMGWILIRKSGTEPLLRFYIEQSSKENLIKTKEFIEKTLKN